MRESIYQERQGQKWELSLRRAHHGKKGDDGESHIAGSRQSSGSTVLEPGCGQRERLGDNLDGEI